MQENWYCSGKRPLIWIHKYADSMITAHDTNVVSAIHELNAGLAMRGAGDADNIMD